MKFCVAPTFLSNFTYEYVMFEDFQVVGSKFFVMKLVDEYHKKTHFKNQEDCIING